MAFTAGDLRAQMAASSGTTSGRAAPGTCAPGQYADLSTQEPDEISERGTRTWWVRGHNFALAYSLARPGEVFDRADQPDEYMVLFPREPASAVIHARGADHRVDGAAVVVVPAGDSRITMGSEAPVVRLFSAASPELLARCRNHDAYAEPQPAITAFAPWPAPVDGPAVRVYRVADHPYQQERFARIVRCSTFMVNLFDAQYGPRDPASLSPHSHEDFEQCSLVVEGDFIHHVRYPWTTDRHQWRDDEHVPIGAPSVAIIPPPAVHTSEATGQARNQLVDIFCPPRADFSAQPGWVINEADYPQPGAS